MGEYKRPSKTRQFSEKQFKDIHTRRSPIRVFDVDFDANSVLITSRSSCQNGLRLVRRFGSAIFGSEAKVIRGKTTFDFAFLLSSKGPKTEVQ
jgi:hypothetical protein